MYIDTHQLFDDYLYVCVHPVRLISIFVFLSFHVDVDIFKEIFFSSLVSPEIKGKDKIQCQRMTIEMID